MSSKRIYIVGMSTSGKTTFAKKLAKKIKARHYDLDDFFFRKKYFEIRTDREITSLIKRVIGKKKWVIEGAYAKRPWVRMIYKKADVFIWIDKPSPVLAWRILKREMTKPKPHKGHSRMRSIFDLLNFLRKYKLGHHAKIHCQLVRNHPRGYVLRTNGQIENFLNDFKL